MRLPYDFLTNMSRLNSQLPHVPSLSDSNILTSSKRSTSAVKATRFPTRASKMNLTSGSFFPISRLVSSSFLERGCREESCCSTSYPHGFDIFYFVTSELLFRDKTSCQSVSAPSCSEEHTVFLQAESFTTPNENQLFLGTGFLEREQFSTLARMVFALVFLRGVIFNPC